MKGTVLEIFEDRVNRSGEELALRSPLDGFDHWQDVSWKEWWERAERIAAGLIFKGVAPGDRVAVLSRTRIEWVLVDVGIWMAGATSVPLYPTLLPEGVQRILQDSQPRFAFVEDPSQLDKVLEVIDTTSLEACIYFDPVAVCSSPDWKERYEVEISSLTFAPDRALSLDGLETLGRRELETGLTQVVERRRQIRPESIASIVYTSGTSGEPQGVELTHQNFAAEVNAIESMKVILPTDVQLLFLPLSHIFGRVLYLAAIGMGVQTVLLSSTERIVEALQAARPTFFAAVPQIFERMQHDLVRGIRGEGVRAHVFDKAMTANKAHPSQSSGPFGLRQRFYDAAVHGRIRSVFGGRLRFMISGGAALPVEVAEFFSAAGLPIMEGYGLTETCAVASVNTPEEFRFGSVGRPLPGVEITVDEDGEILIRGESVMRCYYNDEDSTREVFDDGWFRTGDLGTYDRDGFLWITGRKKDLLVTSGGKNISPQLIETKLEASGLVAHAIAVGDGRPFVGALIVLEPAALQESGVTIESMRDLPEVRSAIAEHVGEINRSLATYQTIRSFALLPRGLTGDELTPTRKVRRQIILQNFSDSVEGLYES